MRPIEWSIMAKARGSIPSKNSVFLIMSSKVQSFRLALVGYLPDQALDIVVRWFKGEPLALHLKRPRSSRLGDFRPPVERSGRVLAKITVNHNLNPYAFLVTLTHEYAHYLVWKAHGLGPAPHGPEWKKTYAQLMREVLKTNAFPKGLSEVIEASLLQVKAASCSDPMLYKALKKYDEVQVIHLDDLPMGALFSLPDGRTFEKGPLRRTRYLCKEVHSQRAFTIAGVAEVTPLEDLS